MNNTIRIMNILLLVSVLVNFISCQPMPKKPPILPLMDDIPFITCDVCKKAATVLFKTVRDKRKDVTPSKFGEEKIISIIEKSCDPESDEGSWIAKLDIVEDNDKLSIVSHSALGRCKEECKTISRACENSIGDIDTDIGEVLWQNNLKLSPFINKVCFELSDVCNKKKLKLKKGKRKDYKFIEMDGKEIEAMEQMKKMKGMPGMPGMEMYSREDMEAMREQMGMGGDQMPIQQEQEKEQVPPPEAFKTQLNFFDTVKLMGRDLLMKVKTYFGYNAKSEL